MFWPDEVSIFLVHKLPCCPTSFLKSMFISKNNSEVRTVGIILSIKRLIHLSKLSRKKYTDFAIQ